MQGTPAHAHTRQRDASTRSSTNPKAQASNAGNDLVSVDLNSEVSRKDTQQSTEDVTLQSQKPQNSDVTDEDYTHIDADKMLNWYGYGKYQLFGYFLCQMLNFVYSAAFFVTSFTLIEPKMNCALGGNNSLIPLTSRCTYNESNYCVPSQIRIEETIPVTSQIREYGIGCDHAVIKEGGTTIFTIGAIFTVPVMCILADRFGRRPLLLLNTAISVTLSCLLPWVADSYWVFILLRLLIGATSDSFLSISNILTYELVSNKSRAWITLVYTIAWSLGMAWVALITKLAREWRWFYMGVSLPGVLTFSYFWFLPESPHWLLQKQKTERVKLYVARADACNKRVLPVRECLVSERRDKEPEFPGVRAMLANRRMLKLLLINGWIQFTMSFVYFAISMAAVDDEGGQVFPFLLTALIDIPGGLLVIPAMMYFGRRPLTLISLLLTGIAMGAAAWAPESSDWLSAYMGLMLVAKTFNNFSYAVHPIYASEMIPTCVRSFAFSIINVPQSLGILIAPVFKHVKKDYPTFTYILTGLLCVASAVGCVFMPETKNRPMPTTLDDLYKETKQFDHVASTKEAPDNDTESKADV